MKEVMEVRLYFHLLLLFCVLVLFRGSSLVMSTSISATFSSDVQLNHLAVNNWTGAVYIGAVNKLFQFQEDLDLTTKVEFKTGPRLDNAQCYPISDADRDKCSTMLMTDTDNYNQILAVDTQHNQLVACGTVLHGACITQSLTNISVQISSEVCCTGTNDPTNPMAGIVAPGPNGDNVLYLATASTDLQRSDYLQTQCKSGVCSLAVNGTVNTIFKRLSPASVDLAVSLQWDIGIRYKISYVTSFSVNGYTYFLTKQPQTGSTGTFYSKIIQICQNDQWYDSFVEMPIICGDSNNFVQAATFFGPGSFWANKLSISKDDFVLFGIFSGSTSYNFCFYSLPDIRKKFTENIQPCVNGTADSNNLYDKDLSIMHCSGPGQGQVISDSFCGNSFRTVGPLVGSVPLKGTSLNLSVSGLKFTAIQGTAVNSHTVLFLGTDDGQILKFVISENGVQQFGSVQLNSGGTSSTGDLSVNKDLVFNADMTHLYVMTKYKVFKVRLFECEKFRSCSDCLSARDPFCGWCTLESRCSARAECQKNELSGRWVFPTTLGSTANCPALSSANPEQADVDSSTPVSFNIQGLPPPLSSEQYSCIFGSDVALSSASYSSSPSPSLSCSIPKSSGISVVGNLSVKVGFRISSSNVSLLNVAFMLYNCSSFSKCTLCNDAPWNCHWCIQSNVCQHQGASCSNPVISGSSSNCPRISSVVGETLVFSGSNQEIPISVANLPSLVAAGANNFKCKIGFAGTPKLLSASKFNDSLIICDRSEYTTTQKEPSVGPLQIVWGSNGYPIDGDYNVTVYNCSAMSEGDCSICLSLQTGAYTKFNCAWCRETCQPVSGTCPTSEQSCPGFTVSSIYPSRVPFDGGSNVTISGTNLGSLFSLVQVEVNGIQCTGIENRYMASRQYVFVMPNVAKSGSVNVKITVTNDGKPSVVTKTMTATDPKLNEMTPTKGPESGGTLVTLKGVDLQSGSTIAVEFGGTVCEYDSSRSNDTHLLCKTTRFNHQTSTANSTTVIPQSAAQTLGQTIVRFDSAVRRMDQTFEFTADPTINPKTSPDGSFKSGGCRITVTGTNLDKGSNCTVRVANVPVTVLSRSATNLIFVSPRISDNLTSVLSSTASFQLDAVSLSSSYNVYPDPFIFPLNGSSTTYSAGNPLYLRGLRLNTSCMVQEIVIMIGSKICEIKDRTEEALYCIVPNLPSGEKDPEVVVTAGENLVFRLGSLKLQPGQGPWPIAVGVIGGVSLIVIILVVAILVYKRVEGQRRVKRLTQQLELLERNVREQCKLAFSELQTEVSDFNSDLEKHGIPVLDFKTYAFRLLFPTVHNHPVLTINRNTQNKFGGFDEQMQQFNQLLSSQVFILTFIDVLDKQLKAFSMNDRTKVSSLLGVILLNRMEFAMDIIKQLLGDLIKRSVEKKTPKLMLRSTESLVEKLLANWLSLSMFEYLRDSSAGNALFMLYKALKHQMEKGPIDAVTAEAKNTVSEDRLLRENVEATVLNITIFEENRSVTCKALSSDTISQVKEKALDALYKNIPYSKRPSLFDVHIAWKTGNETVLPLSDDQPNSIPTDGWKRINTLEHYHIPDNVTFVLSQRTLTEEDSMETVAGYMSQHFGHTLKSENDGTKLWHLVKHEDRPTSDPKAPKVISEIFLTRLLSTKMIMDPYIKDLFEAIFKVDNSLPLVVKYLYDFLDEEAQKHGVDDDVVRAWKCNSLLLRFWINVISNPAFVFDINKSNAVGSCLTVVSQAFIDSCSTQDLVLGKDSPSTKLLFAKDIPVYRKLVQQFFTGIRNRPPVSDKDMEDEMVSLSKRNKTDFNLEMALRDLYVYADKFQYELMVALKNNPSAKRMHLSEKFQDIQRIMHPD